MTDAEFKESAAYQFDKLHDAMVDLFMAICEPWAVPVLNFLERTLEKVYGWFDER